MSARVFRAVLAACVVAIGWYVWPTPWRALPMRAAYERSGALALRVHRITGTVQVLAADRGWVSLQRP